VRTLLGVAALAVAAGLVALQRDHDRCQDAVRAAYLASAAPEPELRARAVGVIESCAGAEPLTRVAVGLRVERPAVATLLAREAAAREPDSYVAWGVLAVSVPAGERERAAERARALNPLSVAGGP